MTKNEFTQWNEVTGRESNVNPLNKKKLSKDDLDEIMLGSQTGEESLS